MSATNKGDCCELMKLVLDRGMLETRRVGIQLGHFFSLNAGSDTGSAPIVYFKKAKRAKGEAPGPYDESTYAPFSYCPFCGSTTFRPKEPVDG